MLLDAGLVQCNLITRPSEKSEGGSGREAGVEVNYSLIAPMEVVILFVMGVCNWSWADHL